MTSPPTRAAESATGRISAVLDLILPLECAGCAAPGVRWCPGCAERLPCGPPLLTPSLTGPQDPPLPVYSAGAYADPLRSALISFKDRGRGDLVGVLAPLLTPALAQGLLEVMRVAPGRRVVVVPIPSRPGAVRARGQRPVERLARAALAGLPTVLSATAGRRGVALIPALRVGRVADQAGLPVDRRRENLHGAMWVRRSARRLVAGAACLLVDDIVTTGSTLIEGAQTLLQAGADAVLAATVAATKRT